MGAKCPALRVSTERGALLGLAQCVLPARCCHPFLFIVMSATPSRLTPGKTATMALVRMTQGMAQRTLGLNAAAFCARTQVLPAELAEPEGRIDALRYERVQQVLQHCLLEGSPPAAAPLSLAQLMPRFPALVALWSNCPTLGDALASYAHYRPLLGEFDELIWQADGDTLRLVYRPEAAGMLGLSCAWGNFLLMQALIDFYGDDAVHQAAPAGRVQTRIELASAPQVLSERMRAQLALPRHRRAHPAADHSLTVQGTNLWRPVARYHPLLHQHARAQLDAACVALHAPAQARSPTRLRVQATLAALWQGGDVHDELALEGKTAALAQTVAEQLGLSRWTLRRHLAHEGCRFQDLVDTLRADQAQALLAQGDASMLEISQRLGFASPGSFSRFYSARFQRSPSQARALLRRPKPTLQR
jgi:AraC-like DNA-binding protein